jgi:hypothetical protein
MQAGRLRFYLGSHQPHWLWHAQVPLMVSARQLARRARRPLLPQATCRWALDSGGFTELSLHGRWTQPAAHYAEQATRRAVPHQAAQAQHMLERAVHAGVGGRGRGEAAPGRWTLWCMAARQTRLAAMVPPAYPRMMKRREHG